jgi:hypothetical protein
MKESTFGAYNPLIVGMQNATKRASSVQQSPQAIYSSSLSVETVGNRPISSMYGAHGGKSAILAGGRLASTKMSPPSDSGGGSGSSPRHLTSGSESLSSSNIKVLMPTSPSAKTSYPPGTMLQSLESLQEATIRASFSDGSFKGESSLHALEEGVEEEHDEVDT